MAFNVDEIRSAFGEGPPQAVTLFEVLFTGGEELLIDGTEPPEKLRFLSKRVLLYRNHKGLIENVDVTFMERDEHQSTRKDLEWFFGKDYIPTTIRQYARDGSVIRTDDAVLSFGGYSETHDWGGTIESREGEQELLSYVCHFFNNY